MNLTIPDRALVVLVGPAGAGKTTFAARHFRPSEVVSSDECRGLVSDDENDMTATPAAFRVLHLLATERLRARRLTVIDATNVQPKSRRPLLALARDHKSVAVAIVFDLPVEIYVERNRGRANRNLSTVVINRQLGQMKRSLAGLADEGFDHVFVLDSTQAIDSAVVLRIHQGSRRLTGG